MAESAQRVPEDSAAYREFARLYDLARRFNPTEVDGWSRSGRALYATSGPGGFDRDTGAIGIDEALLRHELTSRPSDTPRRQAHALATVLRRATEAGTDKDAPGAANAVRNDQSLALHDGVAAVRAAAAFDTFTTMAGYPDLVFDSSRNTGTYAATNDLVEQVSGPRVDRVALLDQLGRGPVAMHFDQLAEAVVQNRLHDVVRDEPAVRNQLIRTMLHPAWDKLAARSPEAGLHVAGEIRQALNAKVEELRAAGPRSEQTTATDGVQRAAPDRTGSTPAAEVPGARFLTGMAPAGRAVNSPPQLGQGSRRPGTKPAVASSLTQE
jgi:hypothetical protein